MPTRLKGLGLFAKSRWRVFVVGAVIVVGFLVLSFRATASRVSNPVFNGKRISAHFAKLPMAGPDQDLSYLKDAVAMPRRSRTELIEFMCVFGNDAAMAQTALLTLREECFPALLEMLGTADNAKTMSYKQQIEESKKSRVVRAGTQMLREIGLRPKGLLVPREQAVFALISLAEDGCDLGPIRGEISRLENHADADVRATATYVMRHLAWLERCWALGLVEEKRLEAARDRRLGD